MVLRNEAKEFFVRDIGIASPGDRKVVGVSNNSTIIRVGDVFVVRYDKQISRQDASGDRGRASFKDEMKVSLTIAQIEWPRGQIAEELPQGHTGVLRLIGDGLESVTRNCFLRT